MGQRLGLEGRISVDIRFAELSSPTLFAFERRIEGIGNLVALSSGLALARTGRAGPDFERVMRIGRNDSQGIVKVERLNFNSPLEILLSFPATPYAHVGAAAAGVYMLMLLFGRVHTLRLNKAKKDVQVELLKAIREDLKLAGMRERPTTIEIGLPKGVNWLYDTKRGERPRIRAVRGVCQVMPQCSRSRSL